MALISAFFEILQRPTIWEMFFELFSFLTPIWVAVLIGVLVGWVWKPKWVKPNVVFESNVEKSWFLSSFKFQIPSHISWIYQFGIGNEDSSLVTGSSSDNNDSSLSKMENENSSHVNGNDVRHLYNLVEEKDGGPVWMQMMDRSTANMSYQAWKREPETGPPQYRSRTVYEDASPELLRDFFWDDEFRMKWDDMILHAETLEECHTTGTMVVQWVRKFPFFCSDREYIIGRRIWESEGTYYCVTKGVRNSVLRRNKPRRVDLYYSSWCIRAALSKRDGRMTSCEVVLFHHEDMGIPWEIAKLGVRQGMWGAVRKIDRGMRMYQTHRASSEPLSPCALMAQINTKFSADSVENLEITSCESDDSDDESIGSADSDKSPGRSLSKFVFIGGAVALACSLDRGLLTKAVIFGVARRFARTRR